MTTCKGCGIPEARTTDANGRPLLNLNPLTGLCTACTVAEAAGSHTFRSRRLDRLGKNIDAKSLSAGRDE